MGRGGEARGLLLGAVMVAPLAPLPVSAQTASQITPPSYAPAPERPAAPVIIPRSNGVTAPAGSDQLMVTLSGVTVDGAAVDPEALAALRARVVGHRVSVAAVFDAARDLESGYARAGRVLTRVVVPAQQLDDGATLRLEVVDGYIERIDTSGVPARVRGRIAAVLAPLAGQHGITLGAIERRLLLAGDVPGVTLRSTLAAGEQPGGTVVVIEGEHQPVSGFVSVDNTLPGSLGRYAVGLGLDLNSVLGLGETIYLRASGFPNTGRKTSVLDPTPRNRALAGGVIVPLGNDGLTLNVEATDARTAPRHGAGVLGVGSRFQRLTGRLDYPFVRRRGLTVTGEVSFDAQDEHVDAIDPLRVPLSLDRLRIVRGAGSVAAALPGNGAVTARVELSAGIDGLGARSAAQAGPLLPLSRQGADADFQKLAVTVSVDQPIAAGLAIGIRARAQTSFGQALLNAEQIGIATSDGLSPLPSGLVQGDAGYVVRGELSGPLAWRLGKGAARLSPYVFGAVGGVRFEQPSLLERRETGAYALGGGARVTLAGERSRRGILAGVEAGRAHVDGLGYSTRVTFSFITRF